MGIKPGIQEMQGDGAHSTPYELSTEKANADSSKATKGPILYLRVRWRDLPAKVVSHELSIANFSDIGLHDSSLRTLMLEVLYQVIKRVYGKL